MHCAFFLLSLALVLMSGGCGAPNPVAAPSEPTTASTVASTSAPTDVPPTAAPTTAPTETPPASVPTAAPTIAPTATPPVVTSDPITGAPVLARGALQQRPIVVMIDNHPNAYPQSGLDKATVVFEALAEFGLTRFYGGVCAGDHTRGDLNRTGAQCATLFRAVGDGVSRSLRPCWRRAAGARSVAEHDERRQSRCAVP